MIRGATRGAMCVAGIATMGVATGAIAIWAHEWGALTAALMTAALLAGAVLASAGWWRGLDEAAREAHKSAWFWGGNLAFVAVGAACVALMAPGGAALLPRLDDPGGGAAYVVLGVMVCLVPQLVGYALVWAGWWLARR